MDYEITSELLADVETALSGLLKQLVPGAAFRITRRENSLTLTLNSEMYPRFVTVTKRDMQPMRPSAAWRKARFI